ncbi:7tm Odorant receptor, partial [Popillia japonica]
SGAFIHNADEEIDHQPRPPGSGAFIHNADEEIDHQPRPSENLEGILERKRGEQSNCKDPIEEEGEDINGSNFNFLSFVLTICSIQFAILQDVFKNILEGESKGQRIAIFGETSRKISDKEETSRKISDKEMLLKCLEQHQLLIGICNELEQSFNISILIQFVVSISAICAASLILMVDSSQFLKMVMYAAAHVAQLFYYCFAGHALSYESDKLTDAIYGCNWHLFYDRDFRKALVLIIQRSQHAIYGCNWHLFYDRDFRKALVLIIQRSQRVQYLTAAGIAKLDFESFIKVMRLSFSFYTLLNSLLAKNIDQS